MTTRDRDRSKHTTGRIGPTRSQAVVPGIPQKRWFLRNTRARFPWLLPIVILVGLTRRRGGSVKSGHGVLRSLKFSAEPSNPTFRPTQEFRPNVVVLSMEWGHAQSSPCLLQTSVKAVSGLMDDVASPSDDGAVHRGACELVSAIGASLKAVP
jgi:hypothetical protein